MPKSPVRVLVATAVVAALSLPPAFAQKPAMPAGAADSAPPAAVAAEGAAGGTATGSAEAVDPALEAYFGALRELAWIQGPTDVAVAGNSTLVVPEGYVFLQAGDTKRFLELNENFGDGREVMIAPESLEWTAYLEFDDSGYVKDDEKIDAAALLATMRENTEAANEERRRRGWADLRVIDWAHRPEYNPATKRLEWATLLESDGGRSVNFSTKVLGRRGHTSVVLVTDPEGLPVAQQALDGLLDGYRFDAGETYAEWVPGDKVAEYGLAALVLGGAAAVATKKGFWAVLAGFLGAAWKFLAAGVFGLGAWLKSRLGKKADAAG